MATLNTLIDVIPNSPLKPKAEASEEAGFPPKPISRVSLAEQLRSLLSDSVILTAESEGYAESLKRWAESAEKQAVSESHVSFAWPFH